MSTTYDYIDETDKQFHGVDFPVAGSERFTVVERTFDAAEALDDLGASAWVANDVVKLIDVPAKTLILGISVRITSAESTDNATLDIGDGDDPNGWEDGIDATTTTHIFTKTYANGGSVTDKDNGYYASADTIDAVLGDVVWTDGVFNIKVVMVNMADVN